MTRPAVEVDEDDARYHPVTSGGRKRGLDITSVFNWVPWCPALSVPAGFRSVCTSPLRLIGKTQLFASPPPSNASIRINGHRSGNRECNREREVDMATNELSVRRPFPQTFVGSRGHSLLPGGFGKALTAFGPWSPMAGLAPVGRHEARAGGLPGQFHCQRSRQRTSGRCEPEWRAGSWRIEPGANGSLIVRNDDTTVNPSSSTAEERSEDAVTLKAANGEAAWRLQRMAGCCNYDASTLSPATPSVH
jgi:hypothetical protein